MKLRLMQPPKCTLKYFNLEKKEISYEEASMEFTDMRSE